MHGCASEGEVLRYATPMSRASESGVTPGTTGSAGNASCPATTVMMDSAYASGPGVRLKSEGLAAKDCLARSRRQNKLRWCQNKHTRIAMNCARVALVAYARNASAQAFPPLARHPPCNKNDSYRYRSRLAPSSCRSCLPSRRHINESPEQLPGSTDLAPWRHRDWPLMQHLVLITPPLDPSSLALHSGQLSHSRRLLRLRLSDAYIPLGPVRGCCLFS